MATHTLADAVPGTVHLVDLEHTLHTRHAGSGAGDIVLVPTPSNDPNDPLNWDPRRKLMATICSNLYASPQRNTLHSLTSVQIYLDDRNGCFDRVLSAGATLRELGCFGVDPQRRHWLHVLTTRLGPALLAAVCPQIWQAASISDLRTWCNRNQHLEVKHHSWSYGGRGLQHPVRM